MRAVGSASPLTTSAPNKAPISISTRRLRRQQPSAADHFPCLHLPPNTSEALLCVDFKIPCEPMELLTVPERQDQAIRVARALCGLRWSLHMRFGRRGDRT